MTHTRTDFKYPDKKINKKYYIYMIYNYFTVNIVREPRHARHKE